VARVQDTDKFVDKPLCCNSRGVISNNATRTVITFAFPRLDAFSLGFSTVFQVFLTNFLIDSGYKTPIESMDEMFTSGIKLAYPTE
jgi:hypothetical protein